MPKVSVVLPTYNGEKYIRESIDSIIGQTFTDWELIIVNDCSIDHTSQIVREYEKKDERIRVIDNPENKKLPESLNIGFRNAVGEYLTWTSDDNMYLPSAFQVMCEYLDSKKDVPMVVGNMDTIDENNKFLYAWGKYDEELMYFNDYVGACFMYRSSILPEIGEYDTEMCLVEDYDYWLRILVKFGRIGHIDKKLYQYRLHSESLTMIKQNRIKKQLSVLRERNLDAILERLYNNKQLLCQMYYEFYETSSINKKICNKFFKVIPELMIDCGNWTNSDAIVYGAGDMGNKAFEMIGERIKYYADGNVKKIGQIKNGIKIISIEEMIKMKGKYQIIVAVGKEKMYEILLLFANSGVATCNTLYSLGLIN